MTARAALDQLRKSRTTEVVVDIDGEPASFLVQKIKVGQRKRLSAECVDEHGVIDLEQAAALACEMCVVEPALTAEDVAEMDVDVFLELSAHIARHTGLSSIQQAAIADPEEGSAVVKSFPSAGPEPGVGGGVDEAAAHAGAVLDA